MPGACVFCKIAAGEIPATVVKRGDGMLAFQDMNPQAPTHLLVIPTHHVATLNDTKDAALLGKLLGFARDLARAAPRRDEPGPQTTRSRAHAPPLHHPRRPQEPRIRPPAPRV